ncbi:hemolymph lipopolysaccharide-binding protein-like [Anabrus simplex]|uniref:hemolymph lipopolysaccharide-binding protein-like n=1 Tax=Anabrus simplex TaxID=316456 RepID=UPI0035A28081
MKPVTPATTTPASTTTTAATTTKPRSCPHSGYRLFGGFNCYKAYREVKSWSDAREQCKRDGGDLMVFESERERSEVFPTMYKSVIWGPWMGVYKPEGEDRWVSVRDAKALLCSFVLQQL